MKCYYCVAGAKDIVMKVFRTFDEAEDYVVCNLMANDELGREYDEIFEYCDAEGWSHVTLPIGIVEIWAENETDCFHVAI